MTRRRWGVAALAAALALVLLPGRADAHAELVSTEPAASEQLDTAPDEVVLRFTESVDITDDTLELLDATGARLDVGEPEHPDGDRTAVAASLPDLDDGAYVVAWRVVSSDSHPISGAFTFQVGDAVAVDDQAFIQDVLGGTQDGDHVLGAAYGAVRFLAFAGLTVLVGAVVFLAWLWPEGVSGSDVGRGPTVRDLAPDHGAGSEASGSTGVEGRARRIVAWAWAVSVVATVLSIPLQGAYAIGGSVGDAFSADVIVDELGTRTGRAWVIRLVLLAAAAFVLPRLASAGATTRRAVSAAGGLALLATITFTGHAVSGDLVALAVVADLVHLSGVSVWLGGLVVLVAALLFASRGAAGELGADLDEGADDLGDRIGVVDRFSQVAFGAVVAVVASGVVQAWRQLGGYDALVDTTYGRLLLVKVALVGAMLVAAAFSRSWVRQRATARSSRLALSPGPGAVAASTDSRPARGPPPAAALVGGRGGRHRRARPRRDRRARQRRAGRDRRRGRWRRSLRHAGDRRGHRPHPRRRLDVRRQHRRAPVPRTPRAASP